MTRVRGRPVVVLGVFNADTTYRAARLPRLGETLLGEGFALGPGGKGSNQAVAAARLGATVHLLTRLGADAFGDMALALWDEAGVTPQIARDAASHTGAAFIFVEAASGDNAIIIAPGAGGLIDAAFVEARADVIRGAGVFLTQLEQPVAAAGRGLAIARQAGATTILNPAPAVALPEAMLALCDYVTPNQGEAASLTGRAAGGLDAARAAGDALIAAGAGAAVITLGAQGALYHARDRSEHVAAFDAGPVAETTGAGDAFNGALAAALAGGLEPVAAVRYGCAAAALSVTRPGAAASMARGDEVERLLAAT